MWNILTLKRQPSAGKMFHVDNFHPQPPAMCSLDMFHVEHSLALKRQQGAAEMFHVEQLPPANASKAQPRMFHVEHFQP